MQIYIILLKPPNFRAQKNHRFQQFFRPFLTTPSWHSHKVLVTFSRLIDDGYFSGWRLESGPQIGLYG